MDAVDDTSSFIGAESDSVRHIVEKTIHSGRVWYDAQTLEACSCEPQNSAYIMKLGP